MDAHTRDLLEFDKVRELTANYAGSSLGKEVARQMEPSRDIDLLTEAIARVTEMTEALQSGQGPPLGGIRDVRLIVKRAATGAMLNVEELLDVSSTLHGTGNVYRYRMRLDQSYSRLMELLEPIEDLGPIAKGIDGCLDSRGHVLDMASPQLAEIRQKLAHIDERVQAQIRRLLRDPKIREVLRYPNATMSGDHYVLPVAINHRHKVPGIVHRTSNTGETVFIEPTSVSSLSAERTVIKGEEDREIRRILRRLSEEVGKVADRLSRALAIMAELDFITAKARFSLDYKMYPPTLNNERKLWLRQARHPLLEHLFRTENKPSLEPPSDEPTPPKEKREVVPTDVRLGHTFNLLIITGPNTGGKTVCLKTTGLICMMAQCGMHVPAGDGSSVPIFDHVLADIGDEQSLEQSLSTFSSHVSRIVHILKTATEQSLVLLDEMGAGTDPTEGAALGRAILDGLDHIGCLSMVTTHLGDLKTYAFNNERAENGAVQFDSETLRPTYKLEIGKFGMSNALKIARRLKLPRKLVNRAHRYLRRKQKRTPELTRLQELREEAEKAKEEALRAQHEADQQKEEFRKKQEELEQEAAEEAALKEARLKLKPKDKVKVPQFDQPGEIVRVDHRKNVAVVSVGIGQWEVALEEVFPV